MRKTVIIIEDDQHVSNSLELGFNSFELTFDRHDLPESQVKQRLQKVEGRVVIICDYEDKLGGGTFGDLAKYIVRELNNKGIEPLFVLNSADSNPKLEKTMKGEFPDLTIVEGSSSKNSREIRSAINRAEGGLEGGQGIAR